MYMRSNECGRGESGGCMGIKIWFVVAIALFVTGAATSAMAVPQQYQYDPPACHDCHGQSSRDPGNPLDDIRPYDSVTGFRNLTTGAFKGNHRTHMSATIDANACAKCHNGTGNFLPNNTGHMNDFVNMTSNINNSPAGTATYSRGRYFNWTSLPALGTCSNVNCHFEAATPQWGTAAFTYTNNTTNDCNNCHGVPPSGGATGTEGSHAKHNSYYNGAVQCRKCHADHVSEGAAKFAHATSSGNPGRIISVRLNDPADIVSGSYDGAGTSYLPSQSGSQTFGTCSNTYCHSDGKGNYSAPVWGTAGTGVCGTCHGAKDNATPSAPHATHVGTAEGYLLSCSKCHVRTVKSTANSTTFAAISSTNLHVNKGIEVNFDSLNPSGTYGGGPPKTCSATYCHSNANPYLGTNTPVTQQWSGTLDCGGCHNKAGDTISAPKAWSTPHTKHINTYAANANMTCNACHANTASNNGTISDKSKHANNSKDIVWNAFANNAAPAYNIATHQCRNVYCHGDGTSATPSTALITWSGTFTCNSCHGGSAATPPTSAPHAKHAGNSSPYRYSCAKCHNATTTNGTSIADYSKHVNKTKDVVFANTSGAWSSPNCSNVYCHSIGNLNVNSANLPGVYGGSPYASPAWSGTFACNGCHGRSISNGMPDYANAGAPGSGTSNSHDKHVSSSTISCGECHTQTTKNGITIRTTYPSYHVNRSLSDVYFNLSGNSKNGTYNSGTKTCSATYCHGSGPSIAWGSSTSCNSCHSANNTSFWNRSSAHKLHWEDASLLPTRFTNTTTGNVGTEGTYRFACGSCHRPGPSYAIHANAPGNAKGDAQVFFGYTSPGKNPTYSYGTTTSTSDNGFKWSNGSATCSNTYCHSNGAGGNGSAVNWATISNSAVDIRCKTCHRYTAASFSPMSTQRHYMHVGRYTFGCQECHYATTTIGNAITAKTKHVNKSKDVSWGTMNSGGDAYANASTTCTNIYCHSRGTASATPFAAPINNTFKWNTAGALGCAGCHGDLGTTGGNALSGAHQKHVNPAVNATLGLGNGLGCIQCHAKTVSGNSTISNRAMHVNTLIDYSGVRAGRDKSCANFYCHSNGNAGAIVYVNPAGGWTGGSLGCDGCHGTDSDFDATNNGAPNYVNGGSGTATANSHKKHVGYGIIDTTGCTNCHVKTVNPTTASQFKDYTAASYHLNGNVNVSFKQINSKIGTWNGSTCSATYCHGTAASPAWGSASLACNVCHSANNTLPGAHLIHYSSAAIPTRFATFSGNVSTVSSYRFSCASCHSSAKGATHTNGPASAPNGVAQVFFGFTSNTMKGSYTYGGALGGSDNGFNWTNGGTGCNTTYCHSGGAAVSWTTNNSSTTPAVRCAKCHSYTAINTFGHSKHVVTYGYSCSKCHNATTTNGTAITDKRMHVNKTKDVVWDSAVNGGTVYGSLSCSGIYCHSQGTTFSGTYTGVNIAPGTAASWNGSMPAGCTGCHTGGTATGPAYANDSNINGWVKKNSHDKHVNVWGYTCNQCHNDVTTTGTTITTPAKHVNKAYNLQAGGTVTFTPTIGVPGTSTSSCSNISCHGGNSATWGASLNCQDCHTGAGADVDAFTTPFSKTSPVAIINTGEWTTKGHGSSSNYASKNPGAGFTSAKQCEYCHDSAVGHNNAVNIFRLKNYSTQEWGRNAPCMVCHALNSLGETDGTTPKNGSRKVSAYHYGSLHGTTNSGGQFCWDCHDAHGDANDFMVHKQVARVSDRVTGTLTTTVATTFTISDPPVWGNYVKPAFDGICQVCHTSGTTVAHFKNNQYDTNHNPGTRCTVCHSHSNSDRVVAFKPSTNCDLCHGYPPVRRGLTAGTVFNQNNYTSARYQDYSGGGGSHTIGKHVSATVKASDGWAPCAVCHSNGNLNPSMSVHTMQTPVKPSKITIDVKDRRKADSKRSLGQERYSGKMTDNHDNATGSCSNVNCHFKPSKPWGIEK